MLVETKIWTEDWDVDHRISELGLDKKSLISIVGISRMASAEASPLHPINAAGTLAYQHGTWALREAFVGEDWGIDRENSVEAIRNERLKVRIAYCNVDFACDPENGPKPKSKKGAGSERACNGNLFDRLPQFAPCQDDEYATYYLMVDEKGSAELSRPVIKRGTFSAYLERIFICHGDDDRGLERLDFDNDDAVSDFDPQVIRK
jgi:hypothetical protein